MTHADTTSTGAEAAVERAEAAFRTAFDLPPARRAAMLDAIAERLDAHGAELVALADEATALGPQRLQQELRRTTFQLRLLADEIRNGEPFDATIDHPDAEWGSGPRPDLRRVDRPLGVVAVFGASNFPFAFSVLGGDSASALAAGCAVVHKVHGGHLELGLRVAELGREAIAAAGAPADLLIPVTGRRAAEAIVDAPGTRAVAFTGSTSGGRALFDRAQRRPVPIPFFGELGSLNPVFVTPQAWAERSERILREFVGSATLGRGQFCTKPGILVVPTLDRDGVAAQLRAALADDRPHRLLTPALDAGFRGALTDVTTRPGVEVLVDGHDDERAPGATFLAADLGSALDDPALLADEMFGPAAVVVFAGADTRYAALAEALGGQLTGGIHATDDDDVQDLVDAIAGQAGRVLWNGWPTGVSVTFAQQHGGPYPASTAASTTSVGTAAIRRFLRPVAYQGVPDRMLPPALREANPWSIARRVDGVWRHPDEARALAETESVA